MLHNAPSGILKGMEPVTHFMTGACLGRAGFNRTTAYATLAMTLAAEAPDLDVFWSIAGPVAGFQHHRGWTHTLIGTPVVATIVVLAIYGFDRWRRSRSMNAERNMPVRWGILWLCAWIAALSHILLDYTNNYGVRPFFPFNPRWYAGGTVFIFEPVFFIALLLALIVPALLSLTDREIGARTPKLRGRGWAIFALTVMVALWGWRAFEQQSAKRMLLNDAAAQDGGPQQVMRVALSPYPVNPFLWQAVVETPSAFRVATIDVRNQRHRKRSPDRHLPQARRDSSHPRRQRLLPRPRLSRLGAVSLRAGDRPRRDRERRSGDHRQLPRPALRLRQLLSRRPYEQRVGRVSLRKFF